MLLCSIETGVDAYFCDPHSRWQRGANENTNGLLRQYLPKNTDLSTTPKPSSTRSPPNSANDPRQTLGGHTSAEKMTELLR